MRKEIVITIIITIILMIIASMYGGAFLIGLQSIKIAQLVIIGIMAAIIFVIIYNMKERIKEIKEEDKDDLSQY